MAFEEIRTEIGLLFSQMTNQPEDAHELAEKIREMLSELKANGLPLPQDLVDLEAELEAGFASTVPDAPTS
jgi:hypothetical protein